MSEASIHIKFRAQSSINQDRDRSTGNTMLNPLDPSIAKPHQMHDEPQKVPTNSIMGLIKIQLKDDPIFVPFHDINDLSRWDPTIINILPLDEGCLGEAHQKHP